MGVVNPIDDNNRCRLHPEEVSTLRQRIEWICELLGEPGKPISKRELARRANLSEPAVTMMLNRLKKNPDNSVRPATLIRIAKAGSVTPIWLAFGEGPREQVDPSFGEFMQAMWRSPELQKACAANPERWRLSTVARALSMQHHGGAPDTGWEAFLDVELRVVPADPLLRSVIGDIDATLEPRSAR